MPCRVKGVIYPDIRAERKVQKSFVVLKQRKTPPGMAKPDASLSNKIHGPKSRIRLTVASVWFEKITHFQAFSTVKAEEYPEYQSRQQSGLF